MLLHMFVSKGFCRVVYQSLFGSGSRVQGLGFQGLGFRVWFKKFRGPLLGVLALRILLLNI